MAKKGQVKRQHFVPRCLLRRFSQSAQTTSVFVIGSATFVETAAIKTQCAADYYYGHDQRVETKLSHLEDAYAAAIGDLSVETLESMSEPELAKVRAFVHVQAARTPFASEVQRNAYVDFGRQLYAAHAKVNKLRGDRVIQQSERFADDEMGIPGAHTVDLATEHEAAIADLQVKFVVAPGLMISDHPALSVNLWRDEHPRFSEWPVLGGLLTKGFMYLMPTATNRLIVVYDGDTYKVGNDGSRIAYASAQDVVALNALQTVNASRLLFDSTVVKPFDLTMALHIRNLIREQEGPGPLPLRPAGIPLSFLRIADQTPYDDWTLAMLPSRPNASRSKGF